jgi:hypothetical protein
LAIGSLPIIPSIGPFLGFNGEGSYTPVDAKCKHDVSNVGDVLNLKENKIIQKGQAQNEQIPISSFLKVYAY